MKTNTVGRPGFFGLNAAILSSFGCNAIVVVLRWFLFVKLVKPPGYSNTLGKWNCCCCLKFGFYFEDLLVQLLVAPEYLLCFVGLRGFYFDDLLVQLSVAPDCIVVLPSFYFDGLLIHLLVDLTLE